MVYKHHQKWRDEHPVDSSVFDMCDLCPAEKKQVQNMRRSKPAISYTLEIECSSYWGNFEREFIGYAMGILDDVQMGIGFAKKERALFWAEVFDKDDYVCFEDATESYELLRDYLLETFQECDDWEQLAFYKIDWDTMHKDGRNVLVIQLTQPLSDYWVDIIIPRMKDFFTKKIYKYMDNSTELINIAMYDRTHTLVKSF